jgi:hypothetical protein
MSRQRRDAQIVEKLEVKAGVLIPKGATFENRGEE